MLKMIKNCPACNSNLIVSSLQCPNCKMEMRGEFEMTAFDLIRNKDQLIMDYNQFMTKYRELEAKLLIDTDFSEALGKSRTNKEEREAYINREMARVIATRKSYEHSIDIVNDLLRLRMKEVTNG